MEASVQAVEVVREGSRWRHGPPSPEDLGNWFREQRLHDGMIHDRYVGGLVLIPAKDKVTRTYARQNGSRYVADGEEVVYTPYVKVDTRIAYFRDYVAMHEDWVGKIRPVPARLIDDVESPYFNGHIADRGFAIHPIRVGDQTTYYLACTMEVAIYERESYLQRLKGAHVEPIMQAVGTKQVAMTRSYGANSRSAFPDDNCLMKGETGGVGRALGFLGMLVIGTGVATAEDIQEAFGEQSAPAPAPGGDLPPVVNREGQPLEAAQAPAQAAQAAVSPELTMEQRDEVLRARALELQGQMEGEFPQAWSDFMGWWRARDFGALTTLTGPALRGAVQKLERDLDSARNRPLSDSEPTLTETKLP